MISSCEILGLVATNRPPTTPTLLSPGDDATDVALPVTLMWSEATDPDGDTVRYTVSLATTFVGLEPISQRSQQTTFIAEDLEPGTLYYWMVTADDGRGNESESVVRSFTTAPADTDTDDDPVLVTGISLSQSAITVPLNATHQLNATVEPWNATDRSVTWLSSDATIAAVDSLGGVTGTGVGTTTVVATTNDGNHSAEAVVHVDIFFTVTFVTDGGTSTDPQVLLSGEFVTRPPDPERTGYVFGDWFADDEYTSAWMFDLDTVTEDTTLFASWTYDWDNITVGGPGPAGGVVFHDKGTDDGGWRYLEAAPSDRHISIKWGARTNLVHGTFPGIGYGRENTLLIIAEIGGTFAAQVASDSLNGFDDWFLPSKDELSALYSRRHDVGGFHASPYWSSSEETGETPETGRAWEVNFSVGTQSPTYKDVERRVRQVRRFARP